MASGTREGNPFHQVPEVKIMKWEELPVGRTFEYVGELFRRVAGGVQRVAGRPPRQPLVLPSGAPIAI